MSVESALQALRAEPRFMRNVVRWVQMPARPAHYAAYPAGLDDRLVAILSARGVTALYAHQAEAVAAALRGEHVAVVTAAASGKTLCYNLPVLNRLLAEPLARTLYLFPTKALAQDQLAELRDLVAACPHRPDGPITNLPIATYDGDTPSARRPKIRDAARIVLSNPDMLHTGILPQHTRWAAFFANLRAVVIDEMHVYRGVFGSHVANVLRRLRRICRFYGSNPQFILASATIANPDELATQLVEAPVTLIGPERDAAAQGERQILFYNPPLLDPALGIRRGSSLEAADLAAHFLAHDVQTIVFARARLTTELILTYLREAASSSQSLRGYRGGYLPNERREIERGLRDGSVRGVVATNALELGIDIGRLDAAVLAGYPGTIASARQQMGRAGRRRGVSVAVLVATADALDQYIVTHPPYLLEHSPERALINPDNQVILAGHLACAAAELPFATGETFGAADRRLVGELLADLVEAGQLYRSGGRFFWAGDGYPAAAISLRSGSPDRVVIQVVDDAEKPQVIGELDRFSVPLLLYEGAIYLHEAATYLVEHLDWDGSIATLRPVEADFYTRPSVGEEVIPLQIIQSARPEKAGHPIGKRQYAICWGDVRVMSQATGYKVLRRTTNEVLGFGPIDLPAQVLETQGCWLTFSPELIERLKAAGAWLSDPNDYGPEWPAQRDAARDRDRFCCQGCGVPERDGRQHDVHHRIPFRAFLADASLRPGLAPDQAWRAANRLENLITLCPVCHRRAEAAMRIRSGLGGAAVALGGVASLYLMCAPGDLGVLVEPQPRGPDSSKGIAEGPTITIYEKVPGGVGYAAELYRLMPDLLRAAHDLVTQCSCERGCPGCVGPVSEHEYALDTKALATALLQALGA
jgi:DEAD/DEAH box helicase domain-containing protein